VAKFSRISKLSKLKRQELIITFCKALTSLKNDREAAKLLTDLLSPQELEMVAKRLEIARLLIEGQNYESIKSLLKVSPVTIARVNTWLNISGDGFKIAVSRTTDKKKIYKHTDEELYDPNSWYNYKRRYSLSFWPELLLEELMKQSDKKQKQKLITILHSIENKTRVFKKVSSEFKQQLIK